MARIPVATKAAIRAEYLLGKSVSQLAKQYNFDPEQIGKCITKTDRDNRAAIAEQGNVIAKDIQAVKKFPGLVNKHVTDAKLHDYCVEVSANIQADVEQRHKNLLSKASQLADNMLDELSQQAMLKDDYACIIELLAIAEGKGYEDNVDHRKLLNTQEAWKKLLSTPQRADTLKKITDAVRNIVQLERLSYNMSESAPEDAEKGYNYSSNERARRVHSILYNLQQSLVKDDSDGR